MLALVRTTGLVASKTSVIAQARQYYCRAARQLRAGAHGVCRQCVALSQVLLQTKDMKKRTEYLGSFLLVLVRTTGLVASKTSVIAERANLFAEVIVYAQRFIASNNATHSRDESHNRWLCPLRSISANASACFSLCLRSAAQRAGAHGVCRQCLALSQVLLQTKI